MGPMPTMECHSALQRRDILTPATQHGGQRAEGQDQPPKDTHPATLLRGPRGVSPTEAGSGRGLPAAAGTAFLGDRVSVWDVGQLG